MVIQLDETAFAGIQSELNGDIKDNYLSLRFKNEVATFED